MPSPPAINLAPLQTPPLEITQDKRNQSWNSRWTDPWLKYFAFLNAFFNGGGGSGGSGTVLFSGQIVSSPGQVISVPYAMPPGVGALMIVRLMQDATGGRTITWEPTQFFVGTPVELNYNPSQSTVFIFYTDDRGTGILWYLATNSYLGPV